MIITCLGATLLASFGRGNRYTQPSAALWRNTGDAEQAAKNQNACTGEYLNELRGDR